VITQDVVEYTHVNCSLGPGNEMFDMEVHFHKLLLMSSFRTLDPNKVIFLIL